MVLDYDTRMFENEMDVYDQMVSDYFTKSE